MSQSTTKNARMIQDLSAWERFFLTGCESLTDTNRTADEFGAALDIDGLLAAAEVSPCLDVQALGERVALLELAYRWADEEPQQVTAEHVAQAQSLLAAH